MATYLKNTQTNQIARLVGFYPATVKKMINSGEIVSHEVIKSTPALRKSALLGVEVKNLRMLKGGVLGYM